MDLTTEAVRLGINMARLRAEVASANIAHVDVAGYHVQRADFGEAVGLLREAEMQPSMEGERLKSLSSAALHESVHSEAADANAPVSLDHEVAELETAGVDFQSLTTVMSRRFALMQLAMAGRN
jgi:flagellar basal-body rod protein FlgB